MSTNQKEPTPDTPSSVTREDVSAGLRSLGLPEGAIVLMHSSLSSFGHVQGGADAVIDGVMEVLGPTGTLVVPTLTFCGFEQANRRFDSRAQPSETGLITETVRCRPDAFRSLHPLSSVAALGARAEEITTWHGDTPCGPGSPYWKLWEWGGYSLFVGVGLGCNSMFHVAEDLVRPAYLSYDKETQVVVIDRHGRESMGTFRRYACARLGITRYLAKMESVYEGAGVVKSIMIGRALVRLLPAEDNVALASDVLRNRPEWILTKEQ